MHWDSFSLLGPRGKTRPSGAAWGRFGPSGGAGHALGFNYITPRLGPGCKKSGPRGAGSGRVGPVRVEWGWGGVGHALGFLFFTRAAW